MDYDNTNTGVMYNAEHQSIVRSGTVNVEGSESRMAIIQTKTKDGNIIYSIYKEVGLVNPTKNKTSDKQPDMTGEIETPNGQYMVWGRKKTSQKNNDYTSLSLKPKDENKNTPPSASPPPKNDELNDDVPF